MSVTFITYAQAAADVREWSRRLPEFDAVCGIPRSGTIIAAMLAEFRNVHLVEFRDLADGCQPWRMALPRVPAKQSDRVLVVDDTSWSGTTMADARDRLRFARAKVEFGALYHGPQPSGLDHKGRRLLTRVHEFEWNLLRTCLAREWLVDMDGVLCEDWPHGKPETDADAADYHRHLEGARPLYVPCFPVRGIVTARISGNRQPTERWIKSHGIKYSDLRMFPSGVAAREQYGHARYKADVYAADRGATLFVESSLQQSREIAQRTGRPVLSIEGLTLFNGIAAGEWHRTPAAAVA
jgi:orotate phosphoribosyltransferase